MAAMLPFAGAVDAALAVQPAIYNPLGPGDGWRWFYYLSPYFRFAQFTGMRRDRPVLNFSTATATPRVAGAQR